MGLRPPTFPRAGQGAFITALCAAALLTSCYPEVVRPDVEITGVESWEPGLAGSRVVIGVEVRNPNDFGGSLVWAGYRFEMNGVGVGSGELDAEHEIAPAGVSTILLPLELDHAALVESLLTGDPGELCYTLRGTARLRHDLGIAEVPFEKTGRLSITDMIEEIF
jgi:LEA14-like dessication related protein